MLSTKSVRLAYCDYIAKIISDNLLNQDKLHLIDRVGRVMFDLGPESEFLSTTKTIDVIDFQDKQYRITVQEL